MSTFILKSAILALCLVWVLPVMPVHASQRVALVIGNSNYEHAPRLANPLNDSADLSAALERLGFSVTKLENQSRQSLHRSLQEFSRAAGVSEIALVFYAGHGIEVDRKNYLIPVDAKLASDQDVDFEAVSLDLVLHAVKGASELRLVILDACRDNPFASRMQSAGATRSLGRGLARVEPAVETLVAYAAKEGTVASDGTGRNSPYSKALLTYLEEPGLEVGLMFRKVRDSVIGATGGRQEPFVYGSLSSEGVYLSAVPAGSSAVSSIPAGSEDTSTQQIQVQILAADREFWESIKESDDADEYRAYLATYPKGSFAALARSRLKRLEEPVTEINDDSAGEVPTLNLSRKESLLVQHGLAKLGFDPGPVDGLFGNRTRQAIESWQQASGHERTGQLVREQVAALVVIGEEVMLEEERKAEERRKAQAEEERRAKLEQEKEAQAEREIEYELVSPKTIRGAEILLKKLGYRPGSADGVWDAKTRSAYQSFLKDVRLPIAENITLTAFLALIEMVIETGKIEIELTMEDEMLESDVNKLIVATGTPLHVAAIYNIDEVVEALINHGADVNEFSRYEYRHDNSESDYDYSLTSYQTPLYYAAHFNSVEVAQLLLDNGADTNAGAQIEKDYVYNYEYRHDSSWERTPLHAAADANSVEVAQLLLDNGADPNGSVNFWYTPLHVATSSNSVEVAQLLLDNGADPNRNVEHDERPLHTAAIYNSVEVARLLLDNGADPNIRASYLGTPLATARRKGHKELIELLKPFEPVLQEQDRR